MMVVIVKDCVGGLQSQDELPMVERTLVLFVVLDCLEKKMELKEHVVVDPLGLWWGCVFLCFSGILVLILLFIFIFFLVFLLVLLLLVFVSLCCR